MGFRVKQKNTALIKQSQGNNGKKCLCSENWVSDNQKKTPHLLSKRKGNNNNNNNNYAVFSAAAGGLKIALPSFSVCVLRDAEKKTHKNKCCGKNNVV